MTTMIKCIRNAAAAVLSVASFSAVAGVGAPAVAQSWDPQHDVVRCDAGSDKCVVLQCAGVDYPCVAIRTFDRDKTGDWMKPYGFRAAHSTRRGERWTWYGNLHVTCDANGQSCRELEY